MSAILEAIQHLIASADVRISEHGYDELANDGILVRDVLNGVSAAALVEDYPQFPKGPAALVLQFDAEGKPLHVVWGIPLAHEPCGSRYGVSTRSNALEL